MRSQPKLTLGAICAAVLIGLPAIPACGSDDTDAETGQSAEEVTAVTKGFPLLDIEGASGDNPTGGATGDWSVQLTMDDGTVQTVKAQSGVAITEIWPDEGTDGLLAIEEVDGELRGIWQFPSGEAPEVEVTIEEVGGEERITGRAE